MLTEERLAKILQLLKEMETVSLGELLEVIPASESTIRRDLTTLENKGELIRVHGGATLPQHKLQEATFSEKTTKNLDEKKKIAKYAASIVEHGDCIYLDAGSTIIQMVPYLSGKNIVAVTNGPSHVEVLMKHDIKTYLIGGLIKTKTNAVIGHQAIQSLEHYYFDKSFLGMNGFHLTNGYTTPDPEESAVKRKAIQLAEKAFVLADASKYRQTSFSKVTDLQNAKLITTNLNQSDIDQIRQQTNIKVVDV